MATVVEEDVPIMAMISRIAVMLRSQNRPGALPDARPHHYGLPWEAVEVPAKALETEKRRPASGRTLQKRQI